MSALQIALNRSLDSLPDCTAPAVSDCTVDHLRAWGVDTATSGTQTDSTEKPDRVVPLALADSPIGSPQYEPDGPSPAVAAGQLPQPSQQTSDFPLETGRPNGAPNIEKESEGQHRLLSATCTKSAAASDPPQPASSSETEHLEPANAGNAPTFLSYSGPLLASGAQGCSGTQDCSTSQRPTESQGLTEPHRSPEAPSSLYPQELRIPQTIRAQGLSELPTPSEAPRLVGLTYPVASQTERASRPQTPNTMGLGASRPAPQEFSYASSSPLSSIGTRLEDENFADTPSTATDCSPLSQGRSATKPSGNTSSDEWHIEHDFQGSEGQQFLRFKPTSSQWEDFPRLLERARRMGAEKDGCFKVVIPNDWHAPLPEKSAHKVHANAYKIRQAKRNGFWRVTTIPSEGTFAPSETDPVYADTAEEALKKLKKLFNKNRNKRVDSVRYRVDIPAWNSRQRREAGVPEQSPIHPLKGDKLDHTKAIIPGIHTPYVYESGSQFGATFQIHAEDFRLCSLNHLYRGRKIWIVLPSTAVDAAEEAFGRGQECSQFMRHRAEFLFPDKLQEMGIPFRIVDQMPGETIVILPDAYHEGFSTGYTIAEAKNYAEADWSIDTYQPCERSCRLLTAIPAALMIPLKDGEDRLDLCAPYDAVLPPLPKRSHDEGDTVEEGDTKRIKA